MTLHKVIDDILKLRSENKCNTDFIIDKVNEIEWKIKREIIDVHEAGERFPFDGYSSEELDVELIAPSPYSELYIKYVLYQVDVANNAMIDASNSLTLFNKDYNAYHSWYRKNNMPIFRGNMKSAGYHI